MTIYDQYDAATNEDGEPIEEEINFNEFNKSVNKIFDFNDTWLEKFNFNTGTGYNG